MSKFPMEWLLTVRETELNTIEAELTDVNSKVTDNFLKQKEKKESLDRVVEKLYSCTETSNVSSLVRTIEQFETSIEKLEAEMVYLQKEREMIFNRYNQKKVEVKLLEKVKANFIAKDKKERSKKEEQQINELSLLTGKDDLL